MANDSFDNSGNENSGPDAGSGGNQDNDPERTLITLDQLSQTIEVMTSVVNRLRRHLNDQIDANRLGEIAAPIDMAGNANDAAIVSEPQLNVPATKSPRQADLVIEISTKDEFSNQLAGSKADKVVH